MGKYMSVEKIIQAIEGTRNGENISVASFCELMVHPGHSCIKGMGGCGEGPDDFACSRERDHETNVLIDPRLKELLDAKGISLEHSLIK